MSELRYGSLFSGYLGLDIGVQAVLGGTTAWVADIDKGADKILAHRAPGVPNLGDITVVDWAAVEPVDVLTGGSPCQDLSHAGKRQGMTEGTRSNLWVAMREAIAQLRPPIVVWENVRGAYSAEAASELVTRPGLLDRARRRDGQPVLRALGRVLGDLSDLGYDCRWHGLRAADVEAPHGRFRVFVVATDAARERQGNAGRLLVARPSTHPDGGAGDCATPLLPTPRATDGTKGGPNQRGSSGDLMLPSAVALLPTPKAIDGDHPGIITTKPGQSTHLSAEVYNNWGDYAAAIARWEQGLGRPAPEPTMTSTKGNPQLSPRFVEWLMGLPVGWVTDVPGITRNEALKALGNGVVPQQAAAAVRTMLAWEAVA